MSAMSPIVTTGVVREGMTSLTGNTGWSIAKGSGFPGSRDPEPEVGYTEIVTSPAKCGVFAKLLLARTSWRRP